MKKRFGLFSYIDREAFIWTAGLVYLAIFNFSFIGTIIDLVNHKKLTYEYNFQQAVQTANMVK